MTTQWSSAETSTDIISQSPSNLRSVSGADSLSLRGDLQSTLRVTDEGLRVEVPAAGWRVGARMMGSHLLIMAPSIAFFLFVMMIDGIHVEPILIGVGVVALFLLIDALWLYRRVSYSVVLELIDDKVELTRTWPHGSKYTIFQRREVDLIEVRQSVQSWFNQYNNRRAVEPTYGLVLRAGGKSYLFGSCLGEEEQRYLALLFMQALDGLLLLEPGEEISSEPESVKSFYPPERIEDSVEVANSSGVRSARDVVLPPWMSEAVSGAERKHYPVPFELGITDIWVQGSRLVVDIMPASKGEEVGGWQGGVLAVGGPMILILSLLAGSLWFTGLLALAMIVGGIIYWHKRSIPVAERLSLSPVGLVLTGRTSATIGVDEINKCYMGKASLLSSQPAIIFVDKKGKKYRFGETLGKRKTDVNKVVPTTDELEWVFSRVDEHMANLA